MLAAISDGQDSVPTLTLGSSSPSVSPDPHLKPFSML